MVGQGASPILCSSPSACVAPQFTRPVADLPPAQTHGEQGAAPPALREAGRCSPRPESTSPPALPTACVSADYPNGVPIPVNVGVPINADGSFRIPGWASDPHDLVATLMRVVVVQPNFAWGWPGYQVEGAPWPGNSYFSANNMVACTQIDRASGVATNCGGGGGGAPVPPPAPPPTPALPAPPPAPAPAPGTGVRLVFTPPPVGSLGPITGTVSTPSSIAVYLTCGGVIWGAKPTGTSTTPASGAFTIANWASPGTRDDACEAMTLLALLPGSTGTPVLGAAALPAPVAGAARAVASMQRAGAAPGPVPAPGPAQAEGRLGCRPRAEA